MDTKEIKLRLIEAFIAQKTPTETIPSEVDKLLEYINKDNPENVFKVYSVKLGTDRKNELYEEENLRNIYFSFYDKMDEPESTYAKENFRHTSDKEKSTNLMHSISHGFVWSETSQGAEYWINILNKYSTN